MTLPPDRVQVVKRETAAGGGSALDETPWNNPIAPQQDAIEASGYYVQDATHRDETALIWREDEKIKAKDPTYGTVDLLASGSGLTTAQHKILRQLIHFIDDGPAGGFASGAYRETTGTVFPTLEVWWESASKLKKIVQLATTWSGAKITQEVWKVYDTDGSTVLATVTDAITHSGVFETSRTRTIT